MHLLPAQLGTWVQVAQLLTSTTVRRLHIARGVLAPACCQALPLSRAPRLPPASNAGDIFRLGSGYQGETQSTRRGITKKSTRRRKCDQRLTAFGWEEHVPMDRGREDLIRLAELVIVQKDRTFTRRLTKISFASDGGTSRANLGSTRAAIEGELGVRPPLAQTAQPRAVRARRTLMRGTPQPGSHASRRQSQPRVRRRTGRSGGVPNEGGKDVENADGCQSPLEGHRQRSGSFARRRRVAA